MSRNTEILGTVLSEIIANRANLQAQVLKLHEQVDAANLQLEKFDALIASLQVSTGDSAVAVLIDQQAGANAALTEGNGGSLTDATPAAADGSVAIELPQAQAAGNDSPVAESTPS